MGTLNSDVLRRMRTFEPPPEGFDPHAAPHRLRQHHGFPRRPEAHEHALLRLWQRAFARGQWTVPYPYADDQTQYTVGFWVGLDGWTNGQVLQAGTATTVNADEVSYWACETAMLRRPARRAGCPVSPSTPAPSGFLESNGGMI